MSTDEQREREGGGDGLLDQLNDLIRSLPPKPDIDLVLVTALAPHGEAWRLTEKRWMLLHPQDWETLKLEYDAHLFPNVPARTRLMGIPVEHVVTGSERDREVREALAEVFMALSRTRPPESESDDVETESRDPDPEGET